MNLLYKTGGDIPHADDKLADDLLLQTAFAEIMPDIIKRQIFLAVLTNPLTSPEDIAYRSEILRDLMSSDTLCGELRCELNSLTKLRDEAQRERSKAYSSSKTGAAALRASRYMLMLFAKTTAEALRLLSNLSIALAARIVRSEGLLALKARVAELLSGREELTGLCERLADYGWSDDNVSATVGMNLDADGRIALCRLDLLENVEGETKKSPLLSNIFKKSEKTPERGVRVLDSYGNVSEPILSEGVTAAGILLDRMTRDIFDELCPLARELAFYETAAAYIRAMREKNVPLVYPTTADNSAPLDLDIKSLYDLLLAASYPNASAVVPNDCRLTSRAGVLVTGDNNNGKTVFLRSVGTAQLLFQAGLPIPAQSASMKLRASVRTLYAAAEKEFCAGNDAGRFEQEVRELAPLIRSMPGNSLLLANEIFQTTAYAEGAEGLYHILRYLSARGVSFILVTHLRELITRLGRDAQHLEVGKDHRVRSAD